MTTFMYTFCANNCHISYLINLCHHCIQHFTFEWPKNNSFVLDWIYNKPPAMLYQASTDVVNSCYSYHKPISTNT